MKTADRDCRQENKQIQIRRRVGPRACRSTPGNALERMEGAGRSRPLRHPRAGDARDSHPGDRPRLRTRPTARRSQAQSARTALRARQGRAGLHAQDQARFRANLRTAFAISALPTRARSPSSRRRFSWRSPTTSRSPAPTSQKCSAARSRATSSPPCAKGGLSPPAHAAPSRRADRIRDHRALPSRSSALQASAIFPTSRRSRTRGSSTNPNLKSSGHKLARERALPTLPNLSGNPSHQQNPAKPQPAQSRRRRLLLDVNSRATFCATRAPLTPCRIFPPTVRAADRPHTHGVVASRIS